MESDIAEEKDIGIQYGKRFHSDMDSEDDKDMESVESGMTTFIEAEKTTGIAEEEATELAYNMILPTMIVEPTTNMVMKVQMEELENEKEFATRYPAKRMTYFSGKTAWTICEKEG
eukprot:5252082-Heterocapsa_arctica.AAC.2